MLELSVQTKNIIQDENPPEGFEMLARTGFKAVDFSLNSYLPNSVLYKQEHTEFFDKSRDELERYFAPHKQAAKQSGIIFGQMHMPYPNYIPGGSDALNDYLQNVVAPKSMEVCSYLECPYIVVHGFKLAKYLGSEQAQWDRTEAFLHTILPMAKEMGLTVCIENLYNNTGQHLIEGPGCDARKAAERIDRINDMYHTQVLGFCFDTGHANLVGIDFEKFMTILGERLKVLHIHDNDGTADLHQIPFTFTKSRDNLSSTDWNGFIKGLKNCNYKGTLSFETAPVLSAFPQELKEQTLMFLAQIGSYFANELHIL